MDFLKIAIAAVSATNVMTIFSYVMSNTYGKLFKEPVVLNFILERLGYTLPGKFKKFSGWLAHYIIGLMFATAYEAIWKYGGVPFGWITGFAFGVASGAIGILTWQIMYRLPDEKPVPPLKDYYVQLFIAHILFSMVIVIGFKLYDYDPVSKILQGL